MIFIKAVFATLFLAGTVYVAVMGFISAFINYKTLKIVMDEETEIFVNGKFYKVIPTYITEREVIFKDEDGKFYKDTFDTFLDIQEEAYNRRKQEQNNK